MTVLLAHGEDLSPSPRNICHFWEVNVTRNLIRLFFFLRPLTFFPKAKNIFYFKCLKILFLSFPIKTKSLRADVARDVVNAGPGGKRGRVWGTETDFKSQGTEAGAPNVTPRSMGEWERRVPSKRGWDTAGWPRSLVSRLGHQPVSNGSTLGKDGIIWIPHSLCYHLHKRVTFTEMSPSTHRDCTDSAQSGHLISIKIKHQEIRNQTRLSDRLDLTTIDKYAQ